MKSGLEGRNNLEDFAFLVSEINGLNEVRPRRPEQSIPLPPYIWQP